MYVIKLNDRYVSQGASAGQFVTSTRQRDAVRLPDVVAQLARKDQGYLLLPPGGAWRFVRLNERAPAPEIMRPSEVDRFDLGEWADYPADDIIATDIDIDPRD